MAVNNTAQWWVRVNGSFRAGAGYDAGISGAGTNYANQDSPQLNLTDLTATGSTAVLSSATGGFTSAMIGNALNIYSTGTGPFNFTLGYYFIVGFTNTHNVTLDRNPTNGSAGVGGSCNVGGALSDIAELATAGGSATPTVPSGLVAGNTVNVQGTNGPNPASGDYFYGTGQFYSFPAGDMTNGKITWVGFGSSNDRPRFDIDNIFFYQTSGHVYKHIALWVNSASHGSGGGLIYGVSTSDNTIFDCIIDANGNDCYGVVNAILVAGSLFTNTGSTSAGSFQAVQAGAYGATFVGNEINGWRGGGVGPSFGHTLSLINNLIVNCGADGINLTGDDPFWFNIHGNTVANNLGNGMTLDGTACAGTSTWRDNDFSGNGGYGVSIAAGSTALNDRVLVGSHDYNNYFGNTSGARNNFSAGPNDTALDPQFTNASGGDFSIGTNLKAKGFPTNFIAGTSTSYVDIGAVQRVEPSSLSGAQTFYNRAKKELLRLTTGETSAAIGLTLKAMLVLSSYTFNPDLQTVDDGTGSDLQSNEPTGGSRQVVGGAVAENDTSNVGYVSGANIMHFPGVASGQTVVGLATYWDSGADATSIPVAYYLFGSSIVTDGRNVQITFAIDASGGAMIAA